MSVVVRSVDVPLADGYLKQGATEPFAVDVKVGFGERVTNVETHFTGGQNSIGFLRVWIVRTM